MTMGPTIWGLRAISVIFFLACNNADGRGTVQGSFDIPSCDLEVAEFDLEVDHFAANYFENTLSIRLQKSGLEQLHANGVILEIREVDSVSEHLGEPLEIEIVPSIDEFLANGPGSGVGDVTGLPLTTHQSPAQATLFLNEACPGNTLGFTDGDGTVTMDAIYLPGGGKRIKGSFDLRFIDPRTWKSPEEIGDYAEVQGDFDFNYSHRQPEQPFI
jgi:hypothetical protein